MAINSSKDLTYFLSILTEHKDFLGAIRHWTNLKIGFENGTIWVKDFTALQIDAVEVKTIPYKFLYYSTESKLFFIGSNLPERNIPPVLWTPIERGLPIQLPAFNHNYFGVNERITPALRLSDIERESCALITPLHHLRSYIESAPSVRLKNLSWTILEEKRAFILGNPPLPLQGDTYWQMGDFFIPTGFELELPALGDTINKIINPDGDHWILWTKKGNYLMFRKEELKPLSISSYRLSCKQ